MANWLSRRLRCIIDLGGSSPRELMSRVYRGMVDCELMTRAAAISYYALSALVPFLGVVMTLLLLLMPSITWVTHGPTGMQDDVVEQLGRIPSGLLPGEASSLIEKEVARLRARPPVGLISVGLLLSLWLASSVFQTVMEALNRIHGVKETRSLAWQTLTALAITVIEAAILATALVSLVVWPQILAVLGLSLANAVLLTLGHWITVAVLVMTSFAVAFRFGPASGQRWEWITPGSVMGMIAWLLASLGFRTYVQRVGSYDSTYGALGGVVLLLGWIWLTSLILLVAAVINREIRRDCENRVETSRERAWSGWGLRRPRLATTSGPERDD